MSLASLSASPPRLTVETNSTNRNSIIKIAKRGECVSAKKKLDELFFQWVSQPTVQEEIRQLVKLVRSGKKTNLVHLKQALSPTKEPPRSPTAHHNTNKSKHSRYWENYKPLVKTAPELRIRLPQHSLVP